MCGEFLRLLCPLSSARRGQPGTAGVPNTPQTLALPRSLEGNRMWCWEQGSQPEHPTGTEALSSRSLQTLGWMMWSEALFSSEPEWIFNA